MIDHGPEFRTMIDLLREIRDLLKDQAAYPYSPARYSQMNTGYHHEPAADQDDAEIINKWIKGTTQDALAKQKANQ